MNKTNLLMGTSRVAGTAAGAIGTAFVVEFLPDFVPDPVKMGLTIAGGTLGDVVMTALVGNVLCKAEARKYQAIQLAKAVQQQQSQSEASTTENA